MDSNLYSPPQADLATTYSIFEFESDDTQLAARWQRLCASLVDSTAIALIIIPIMYFTGGINDLYLGIQPSIAYTLTIGIISIFSFFAINGKLLVDNGQTVGKKIMGIKIVTLDGLRPSVGKHLLKRYCAYFIPGQFPIVGQIFANVNLIFILGKQRRCMHDRIAGTKVVKI